MSMVDGQQVSYQQTTSHSQYTSHSQSESRQGSFASLGPANPIPSNYGSGSPPPFTPPPAVSYPEKSGNNSMPGSNMPGSNMPGMPPAGGLLSNEQQQRPPIDNMTRSEFEVAKEKGAIPSWMVSVLVFYDTLSFFVLTFPCVTLVILIIIIEIRWWSFS